MRVPRTVKNFLQPCGSVQLCMGRFVYASRNRGALDLDTKDSIALCVSRSNNLTAMRCGVGLNHRYSSGQLYCHHLVFLEPHEPNYENEISIRGHFALNARTKWRDGCDSRSSRDQSALGKTCSEPPGRRVSHHNAEVRNFISVRIGSFTVLPPWQVLYRVLEDVIKQMRPFPSKYSKGVVSPFKIGLIQTSRIFYVRLFLSCTTIFLCKLLTLDMLATPTENVF